MRTPPPCKSCQKTADTGKKQSTSKKICSAITGILTNEIGKTKNKTKLDILKGGLEYANDVCDSGGTPDLAKITKGLPEKDKARISQKTNAALFDGVADRPDKYFGPNTSKTAALTGPGGQVTDLKSSEPNTPKFSQVTEFSLAGKSNTLLASAKAAGSTQKAKSVSASDIDPNYAGGWCCNGEFMYASSEIEKNSKCCRVYSECCGFGDRLKEWFNHFPEDFMTAISNKLLLLKIQWESIKTIFFNPWEFLKAIPRAIWDALKYVFGNIWDALVWIKDLLMGNDEDCEGEKYNSKDDCCDGNRILSRTEIKDLSDCKERNQYRKSPAVVGCIVTWEDKFRGYGHNNNPTGGGKATSFYDACQAHNVCYADCERKDPQRPEAINYDDKVHRERFCDPQLLTTMNEVCKEAGNLQTKCEGYRDGYYKIIVTKNGPKSHDKAQKANCTCCAEGQK